MLVHDVAYLIAEFTYAHKRLPEWLTEAEKLIEVVKRAIVQVARARSAMERAIPELRSAIAIFGNCESDKSIDEACLQLDELRRRLPTRDELHGWLEKIFGRAAISSGNSGRGRPAGSSHPHFHDFLCSLLVDVNSVGGRLTYDKNYPARGTLLRVLDLLRPILPPGFIPHIPPVRVLKSAQKIARGGAQSLEAMVSRRYGNIPYVEFGEKLLAELERNDK